MDGPAQIGDWQKISELGSGGFGVVSLWKNITNEDCIAIKKCKFLTNTVLTERQKERWNKEVHIMKIINHPNIVKYKDIPSDLEAGLLRYNPTLLPLLPMEYCSKGNLRRVLNNPKNICGLQEEDVRCILEDVSNGLQHLHKLKITHRDIKPDNIVLQHCDDRRNTIYKIIDLGYAKELDNTVASFVGTLHYLAPEIFENVQYNSSVDYWSMGILTFEVVCGDLPFLPLLTPVERFEKIKEKGPEDICIYLSYSGQTTYSSEIKKECLISSCFKQKLEIWLRHVLQFESSKRSQNFSNNIKVFEYLNYILKKKIIHVFSLHKLEFYSYEINDSTLVSTLKDWISRDIKISKNDFIILCNNNNAIDVSDLVVDILGDDKTICVMTKDIQVNVNVSFTFPKLIKELFTTRNFDMKYVKQLYAQTIYYLTVEKTVLDAFKKAFSLFTTYMRNLCDCLKRSYQETAQNLIKILTKLECYNSIRKHNTCDIDLSNNFEYKDCLLYSQRLLGSLERSISNFKALERKILSVSGNVCHEKLLAAKTLIEDCNVEELYNKALRLLEKKSPNKQPNPKHFTSEIREVISETIKIKDKLIHNKELVNHLGLIAKIHNSAEKLNSWMLEFNRHLNELGQSFEQIELSYRNITLKAAESRYKKVTNYERNLDGELWKLPTEYLIRENKEIRCMFEDILSRSIMAHRSYVDSIKSFFS